MYVHTILVQYNTNSMCSIVGIPLRFYHISSFTHSNKRQLNPLPSLLILSDLTQIRYLISYAYKVYFGERMERENEELKYNSLQLDRRREFRICMFWESHDEHELGWTCFPEFLLARLAHSALRGDWTRNYWTLHDWIRTIGHCTIGHARLDTHDWTLHDWTRTIGHVRLDIAQLDTALLDIARLDTG